jgi:hypothetical protein
MRQTKHSVADAEGMGGVHATGAGRMPSRSFRIPSTVDNALERIAAERGERVSEVVRSMLTNATRRHRANGTTPKRRRRAPCGR